jgi:hypothetical protein
MVTFPYKVVQDQAAESDPKIADRNAGRVLSDVLRLLSKEHLALNSSEDAPRRSGRAAIPAAR